VPDNLGQVMQCVSRVNTRLRYVQKSGETSGSQRLVEIYVTYSEQKVSVKVANTDSNAPNGALTTNDTVSGVDLAPLREKS
jgi:hypothetical protein